MFAIRCASAITATKYLAPVFIGSVENVERGQYLVFLSAKRWVSFEKFVAGGVFMRNMDLFMPILQPIVQEESLTDAYTVCKILPAKIGENIGDYAALAIAILED